MGWINLKGLRTLVIDSGNDTDVDGIPDAWEFQHVGFSRIALTILSATNDWDADGVSDLNEYIADTDPMDSNDFLRIISLQMVDATNWVSWPVKPSRVYELQYACALSSNDVWSLVGSPFIPATEGQFTLEVEGATNNIRFYRARATRGPVY